MYIREVETNASFEGTVTVEVLRDRFIGSDPVIYGPAQAELEESVYKFYPQFGDEANYTLRISYRDQGQPWIIDLPMVIGEPSSPWRVLSGVTGGLLVFLLLIRALKIKQQRRIVVTAEAH